MTKPIYALTPDELRAKARERERLRKEHGRNYYIKDDLRKCMDV